MASTNPPYTGYCTVVAISALETDRAEPSATRAASPSSSWRSHPVTVTVPDGGSGVSTSALPEFSVASQPRSTTTAVPSAVTSGVTTSAPASPSRVW